MKIKIILLLSGLVAANVCFGQIADPAHTTILSKELSEDCMVCHVCEKGEVPSKVNPRLKQCNRPFSPKNPSTQDIVIIDRLVEKYDAVVFAHSLHANMSSMSGGCTNCHHFTQNVNDIQSCGTSGCHSDENVVNLRISKPSIKGAYHRQCMGCHREWSNDTDCGFCHTDLDGGESKVTVMDKTDIVGVPHPLISAEQQYNYTTNYAQGPIVTFHHTDHVDLFGLKCTDCHKGDSCSRCHDTEKHENTKIEHLVTCGACHSETNCGFCHSDNPKPEFEHYVSTGWALNEYHLNSECSDCHGSAQKFTKPSTTCTNCHIHWDVGVFDHSVTGLTLNEYHVEEDCEVCHIDRNFSIQPNCTNCHEDISYPDEFPGDRVQK